MPTTLHIGDSASGKRLVLPLELTTAPVAILANRGRGKTYAASAIAEELIKAKQQIVAIDTTGAWWGLKSSADGKKPGFPVVVLGGDHADIPLTETSGEIVATAIVSKRFSAVLDLSLFRKAPMLRFLAAFLETLYRLNRDPLHLFCDEADEYAPQRPRPEAARTLGAMEDIVRRGRRKGIGPTLITQRPAVLNKNVLTQCEILFAMGVGHPLDIAALQDWIEVHAQQDKADEVVKSLPTLGVGEAWVWSPMWGDILERVKIRRKTTFDSSATPKPGEVARVPQCFAPIDVESLGAEIAKAAELGKANDPATLRAKIARLEQQLANRPSAAPATVTVPIISEADRSLLDKISRQLANLSEAAEQQSKELGEIRSSLTKINLAVPGQPPAPAVRTPRPAPPAAAPRQAREPAITTAPKQTAASDGLFSAVSLGKAERLVLTALAQYGQSAKAKVAAIAGYAVTGGGFNNALGRLRSVGAIAGSDLLSITEAGRGILGQYTPLPTGQAFIEEWLRRLGKAERLILEALTQIYPAALTKEELAAQIGYAPTGGGFNNALSHLRTLELITRGQDIAASANLFPTS